VWEPWIVRADITAAVVTAAACGVVSNDPWLLHETNNTVVWLRPEAVVAKVATRPDARNDIRLEHAIAVELVAVGGEIARPLPGACPMVHDATGFVVTLWEWLDGIHRAEVEAATVRESLRRLHAALAKTSHELPSFRSALTRARTALDDDALMAPMPPDDRAFLREVYDDGLRALADTATHEHRLHGEPHDGNCLVTAAGLRWIDFESCCKGPLEWDLAFLSRELDTQLGDIDHDLLALLRRLNSARVATWCLAEPRFPVMRGHGELHLALLRG
jgi:Ser/Thr protein kinase RdoA (MazF antagonist)